MPVPLASPEALPHGTMASSTPGGQGRLQTCKWGLLIV